MSPRAKSTARKIAELAWGDEPMRIDPKTVKERARVARRIATSRPFPGEEVGDDAPARFSPDLRFAEWIRETFITPDGSLANDEHEHLMDAKICVLWTNVVNVRQRRHILATAEIPQTMGTTWKRERAAQQIRDWFECEPDFLLTFYAPECEALNDRAFCALVEHELYHCAHKENENGPMFDRLTGAPIYDLRGHDVEEFTGVVERYGPTSAELRALVAAAQSRPLIGDQPIELACGTIGTARAA